MSTADAQEIDKFAKLAQYWWDLEGPLKTLHDINDTRLGFIQSHCPLNNKRVLDVGCGGGILTESLAKAGAVASGLDLALASIEVAKQHALENQLNIDYQVNAIEDIALPPLEAITCLEMLEHVPDYDAIIKACSERLASGGYLFLSTINRTPKAYTYAIIGAEYVLRLLPKQTHDYKKFITPSELCRSARRYDLTLLDLKGLAYNPLNRQSQLSDDLSVNYLAAFKKST